MQNMILIEMDQSDVAGKILDQRRAAFHPVATVEILHAVDRLDLRAMDVAADDAVEVLHPGHLGECFFIIADMFHGALGLLFEIRRQRPVPKSQSAADAIEVDVDVEQVLVNPRTEPVEQVIEMRHPVGLMPVDDEIAAPIHAGVNRLTRERHIAKAQAEEFLHKLVVVAGDVGDAGLLTAFAQQFLDEQIVFFAPKPFMLELPAINQIAHDVEVLTFVAAEKIQQRVHLGVFRAEMHVGDPYRTVAERLSRLWLGGHKNYALPRQCRKFIPASAIIFRHPRRKLRACNRLVAGKQRPRHSSGKTGGDDAWRVVTRL